MSGFITLHRDVLDHWVYEDAEYFRAWVRMLMDANHTGRTAFFNGKDVTLERGQLVYGIHKFCEKTHMTSNRARLFIKRLEKHKQINKVSNNKYSIITITNYDQYQANHKQTTNKQQSSNNLATTPNNVNNENNVSRRFTPPTKDELVGAFVRKNAARPANEAERFLNFYGSNGWKVGKNKMRSWPHAVGNWNCDKGLPVDNFD